MDLDDVSIKILRALSEIGEGGCGDIGKKAGLPTAKVMGKLRTLKKEGLVDSRDGKYFLTEKGKSKMPP
ncbi:MAG: helix-turn-helix domain-containing protein [Thermoplasmata archaeon]|jgi:DNA-binding IclR family transcriptional regulator|nr:helix-turn-helix domain-containing protein [Thermoplasmata archaeon]MVT12865.1 helix-turn-helix domain-containing protein [Euryarchaeota archaeon]MVT14435.1 helix-turn-helix domain-containing protein [Euryarchaeota archaeon]MVT36200.1 helix-turn-helix domain-containing protein [Euryarchaeota archaeon]